MGILMDLITNEEKISLVYFLVKSEIHEKRMNEMRNRLQRYPGKEM
jgi:hypothetical protein